MEGKLSEPALARLLRSARRTDDSVVLGAALGEDAAVVRLTPGKCVVASTDPVTLAGNGVGRYVVHINANDVAARGAVPRWFLVSMLFPVETEGALVESAFGDILEACDAMNIVVVGGHTELTRAVSKPVLIGTMLGEVDEGGMVRTAGARVGDAILLTKAIGLEGSAIVAAGELGASFSPDLRRRAMELLDDPGISIVREALAAVGTRLVHCMHDVTEGGLANAIHDIATAAEVGMILREEAIPVREETRLICGTSRIDPMGLISSGALILTCAPTDAGVVCNAIRGVGIEVALIGSVVERAAGVRLRGIDGGERILERFPCDELVRIHSSRA
jgi:hydrogenase maturation factor